MLQATTEWERLQEPVGPFSLEALIDTDAAVLRHVFFDEGAEVAGHRHEHPLLVYSVGGPCIETSSKSRRVTDRLVFRPAAYEHAVRFGGPTHMLVFELKDRSFLDEFRGLETLTLPASLYDLVWDAMLSVVTGRPRSSIDRSIAELFEAVRAVSRVNRPAWLGDVLRHLHENWRKGVSARAIAMRAGVSTQHICRAFRRCMGMTLTQYNLALKVDHARGLLWGTRLPLAEIAIEAGFADQSHLTRVLTVHSQVTPLRLRWGAPCLRDLPLNEL